MVGLMIIYLFDNWKMAVHLLFGTYRFGVNNKWWSLWDSMFGKPWRKRINPFQIYKNYKGMKFRAQACYFVSSETLKKIGWIK